MDTNAVVNTPVEQAPQGDAAAVAVQEVAAGQQPETGVTTEAAAPQERSASERFAYALKMRTEEERAKIERETSKKYEPDVEFAKVVRRYFGGKADADIMSDLTEVQVKVYAQEKGISEALAREFIELRNGIVKTPEAEKQPEPAKAAVSNTWLSRLAKQREAIKAKHGVDVVEDMTDAEEAAVMQGDMDLNEVFALRSRREDPPPVNRGMATDVTPKDPSKMSDAEYEAFREKLRREGTIDVRSS